MYKLKEDQESITVVEGPFAGRNYRHGETYAEVPPQEMRRFEEIKPAPAPGGPLPAEGAAAPASGKETIRTIRKFGRAEDAAGMEKEV